MREKSFIIEVSRSIIFDEISVVKSPSTVSYAVAPASVYGVADLHSNVTGLAPRIVIIGGESCTITVLVNCVAALPFESVTLYVTVYEPTILVFTFEISV